MYIVHIDDQYSNKHKHNLTFDMESLGLLVRLGFDVTVFTPASYQRHRL